MNRIFISVLILMGLNAWSAPSTETPKELPAPEAQPATSGSAVKIQKQHAFDDLLIQGQYRFSEESVTTVEADKVLDALIGVRKDFKDRLELSDKGY
jgi:hypothetical protein